MSSKLLIDLGSELRYEYNKNGIPSKLHMGSEVIGETTKTTRPDAAKDCWDQYLREKLNEDYVNMRVGVILLGASPARSRCCSIYRNLITSHVEASSPKFKGIKFFLLDDLCDAYTIRGLINCFTNPPFMYISTNSWRGLPLLFNSYVPASAIVNLVSPGKLITIYLITCNNFGDGFIPIAPTTTKLADLFGKTGDLEDFTFQSLRSPLCDVHFCGTRSQLLPFPKDESEYTRALELLYTAMIHSLTY
ncbi:P10 [Mycoreovirus 1]|uniref:Uncharacterized protein VP10 n=1 Tax=Cryphonectria parasitica mycoreovirus 1 (strain 9B21) TaxID=230407 RepID=VP10_MYRV9|nr:P10 [Mycoreovirus 1]Q65YU6.1 RecName: Full=Uncharacterized protein VP10 [Cryphonectria parasitica mycoreovirus 1]BAD51420.1 P10 [Cryphonectria parasitica mycoreovirus 1]